MQTHSHYVPAAPGYNVVYIRVRFSETHLLPVIAWEIEQTPLSEGGNDVTIHPVTTEGTDGMDGYIQGPIVYPDGRVNTGFDIFESLDDWRAYCEKLNEAGD